MSKYTDHYNLILPNQTENYDVDVANTNNAKVDEVLYEKVDKKPGRDLSENDFTNGYKKKLDRLVEGTRGYSAYEIACMNGFRGDEDTWLKSLKGDAFTYADFTPEQLEKLKGEPNILKIGTVEKGEEASASIEGDSPNQTLNLVLPKGDKGVGVTKIEQTTTSADDGGTNVITITLSNGDALTFQVKNGSKGSAGYTPKKGTDYYTETEKQELEKELLNNVKISRSVVKTTQTIAENTNYTIPLYYEVGNNSLSVIYMGEKLIKDEHYKEVGSTGTKSNKIQFYNWGQAVPANRTIEFIVRGAY